MRFTRLRVASAWRDPQDVTHLAPIKKFDELKLKNKSDGSSTYQDGFGAVNNRGKFIIRNKKTGQLEVEGTGEVVRFSSLCAPELFDNEGFEKADTMRTISEFGRWPVTRTYTLKVASTRIKKGHINGWDSDLQDFIYAEDMFQSIDHTIARASEFNVRLIIPIINQDYGSQDKNWVGNFSDLIRYRRRLRGWEESKSVNWWKEEDCLDSMKKIISKLLNRINTVNGKRIGDDSTILAFETGNEMNDGGSKPAPASWTLEIARHIKKLAPKALVMDGSFARTVKIEDSHDQEVLQNDLVDIMSYHYYGYGDKQRVEGDVGAAKQFGKAFVCGEYGFFEHGHQFGSFLEHCERSGATGTLAWSLRPHSIKGGFKTHGEGNNIWSYHAPGWKPAQLPDPQWDHREPEAIQAIRESAFHLTNDVPPPVTPGTPELFIRSDCRTFSWRGAAWADHYELWTNSNEHDPKWKVFPNKLYDNVKEGSLKYDYQEILGGMNRKIWIKIRGISREKVQGDFSNVLCIGSSG